MSSHLLDHVQSVCERVTLFNVGKIALVGTLGTISQPVATGGDGRAAAAVRQRDGGLPQIVGLIAATIVLFVAAYVVFQRQEVRA